VQLESRLENFTPGKDSKHVRSRKLVGPQSKSGCCGGKKKVFHLTRSENRYPLVPKRDSLIDIMNQLRAGQYGIRFPAGVNIFIFSEGTNQL
jgi:hypothetical protein